MKKRIIFIGIIVIAALVAINFQSIMGIFAVNESWEYQHTVSFAGYEMHTRAPIKEAEKISVYPSEQALKDVFYNDTVYRVRLAFIPNESINGYYGVISYGLAARLPVVIQGKTNNTVVIESFPVNSTEEAKSYSSQRSPVILMLPPWQSNKTAVTVDGYLILLEGETFADPKSEYFDLDLAADKLVLALMEQYNRTGG